MNTTEMAQLFASAETAGRTAGDAVTPKPMYIRGYAPIADGVCGFAWITIRPGNCEAARYAKATGRGHPDTYGGGGLHVTVSDYGQSLSRKRAYAQAYAGVLRTAGVQAYAGSRID